MKHKKIALIGMMGSGKSTIAKLLSKELNIKCYELDEIFEQREKIKIKDFFKQFGEEKFRKIETEILKETLNKEDFIISCGGGVVLSETNRDLLFQNKIFTIYLKASTTTIFERIRTNNDRPLLLVENPKTEIEKILNSRIKYYKQANKTIVTDDKNTQQITKEILNTLWKK